MEYKRRCYGWAAVLACASQCGTNLTIHLRVIHRRHRHRDILLHRRITKDILRLSLTLSEELLWELFVQAGPVDTHALEWKLCKSMKNKSSQVLDVQFGVSIKSLKMVAAYSDGYLRVFELLNLLELKNWQLQAEFQNVIDSLSTLGNSSTLSASVSWNPMKGEEQEQSFVLAFNSDSPHLNSSKIYFELRLYFTFFELGIE